MEKKLMTNEEMTRIEARNSENRQVKKKLF